MIIIINYMGVIRKVNIVLKINFILRDRFDSLTCRGFVINRTRCELWIA